MNAKSKIAHVLQQPTSARSRRSGVVSVSTKPALILPNIKVTHDPESDTSSASYFSDNEDRVNNNSIPNAPECNNINWGNEGGNLLSVITASNRRRSVVTFEEAKEEANNASHGRFHGLSRFRLSSLNSFSLLPPPPSSSMDSSGILKRSSSYRRRSWKEIRRFSTSDAGSIRKCVSFNAKDSIR